MKQIFDKFDGLLKPNGSYFEYMFLPRVKQLIVSARERADIAGIFKAKADFFSKYPLRKDRVWKNVTPARVVHHQKRAATI